MLARHPRIHLRYANSNGDSLVRVERVCGGFNAATGYTKGGHLLAATGYTKGGHLLAVMTPLHTVFSCLPTLVQRFC